MENSEAGVDAWDRHLEFYKAWTAYIVPGVFLVLGLLTGWLLASLSWKLGAAVLALTIITFVYKVLMIRSVTLFTNDAGVWVRSGIFPWSRGYSGVKWRDLDEASMFLGFFSWAFKSYTVKLSHRYTRNNEIYLNHIKHGDKAVSAINRQLMRDQGPA